MIASRRKLTKVVELSRIQAAGTARIQVFTSGSVSFWLKKKEFVSSNSQSATTQKAQTGANKLLFLQPKGLNNDLKLR